MALQTTYTRQVFTFNFQARTSRGAMRDRISWFIKIWDDANPSIYGVGECAPLPGLSIDDRPDFEDVLKEVLVRLEQWSNRGEHLSINNLQEIIKEVTHQEIPSIIFGLETALLDLLNGGERIIFKNAFLQGKKLPINGLIWMADMDLMLQQIAIKIQDGFKCIKMKVGGLNFEKECDILHYIRKKYFREDIIIRLDANGAFKADDCLYKLNELARFQIHSIEQPIKPGQVDLLKELSEKSPIPIALDEELIGLTTEKEKLKVLQSSRVPYIILKPSLHGGMFACKEWIELANKNNVGWWITSALESNIGLNAICQFTAEYNITTPQGLGTGSLYEDNIESPLQVKAGEIFLTSNEWNLSNITF